MEVTVKQIMAMPVSQIMEVTVKQIMAFPAQQIGGLREADCGLPSAIHRGELVGADTSWKTSRPVPQTMRNRSSGHRGHREAEWGHPSATDHVEHHGADPTCADRCCDAVFLPGLINVGQRGSDTTTF